MRRDALRALVPGGLDLAVLLLSAAVLAHEICLLRVLSQAYWHHAASLVVAVALLAFGAAGTVLALVPALRREAAVSVCAGLYAVGIPLSLRAVEPIGFNVLEVGWDPAQWLRLLALEAVFFLVFLCPALAIAVALALRSQRPARTYAANLVGSGLGSLAAPLLLGPPAVALRVVAVTAAVAALPGLRGRLLLWPLCALGLSLAVGGPEPPMSPFKALPSAWDRTVLATYYGPRGRVDRAEVPSLHFAPGLALAPRAFPEHQIGLYVDGHLVGAVDLGGSAYLDDTVGALPFLCGSPRSVLLLGVGPDLQRATRVVEADANLLRAAGLQGEVAEPRVYLEAAGERFDLVVHHLPSLHAAAETPLLTVQGLRAALDRSLHGAAFGCALLTPPRAGLKLLATAEAVTPHVIAVRSADRLCVWMRHQPPTDVDRGMVLDFCHARGFDPVRPLAWRLDEPYHETRTPLVPPGADYPYDVTPATDQRPYFFKFFRWTRIGDLFDPRQTSFVQWPFVALVVAFLQVTALGLLLMALPLLASRAARAPAVLFLALGGGFMLLEMVFLQRAMVLLGSPVHAAAAVLGGFLVGSGLGSFAGDRLGSPLARAALCVCVLAPLGFWLLPAAAVPAALVCGLVAFPMGMPFPAALSRLPAPSVPWALAWNGCASVAAAAAAPLLSSTAGLPTTGAAALLLYLLVAWTGRSARRVSH